MLINKPGDEFLYNGITYRVGDVIIGSDKSEYAGLIGSILEIQTCMAKRRNWKTFVLTWSLWLRK